MLKEIKTTELRAYANSYYHQGKNKLLAMFGADEQLLNGYFAIYCVFQNNSTSNPSINILKSCFPENSDLTYPSLTPLIPAANWYEREMADMFGFIALEHPDLRPLVLHENYPEKTYPLRKKFAANTKLKHKPQVFNYPKVEGEGVFEVPVGPIHAGIIEPGHFIFSQAGETVLNLEAKLFFTHRGIEKNLEGLSPVQALYLVERICGACAVSHALSFTQAIENLGEHKVSKRAQLFRVFIAELERIYNHIGDTGNICAGIGFAPIISHCSRLKEYIMRINEDISGNRFLRGAIIIGGVNKDISVLKVREIISVLNDIEREYLSMVDSMYKQQEFVNRVSTTGIVPNHLAKEGAFSGIAARATGILSDTRKDFPYLVYDELNFKIITEQTGDVDARIKVRIAEVQESLKILRQITPLLDQVDDQPLFTEIGALKTNTLSIGMSESARGNNLHALIIDSQQNIYRTFVRSASYSNWPALPIAAPNNIIPDFPLINKSFELCYACLDR